MDSSLDFGCAQLVIPVLAWRTTSSFWPTRIVAVLSFSLTATSKFRLGLVLGVGLGLGLEPVATLPHPEMTIAAPIATSRILISST
jgi:hypothetical protein